MALSGSIYFLYFYFLYFLGFPHRQSVADEQIVFEDWRKPE